MMPDRREPASIVTPSCYHPHVQASEGFRIAADVADALRAGRPVVALESTLVAHGMPWPENLEVATRLEDVVRAAGAVPATIAVVRGVACIGLGKEDLRHVAEQGPAVAKSGAADIAVHIAMGADAATTVSATSVLAARAGIRVFATGGIGGVHRQDPWDVSHDLAVLARTPVAVVSAGAKAILDLPRTLEVLETLGVLVVGVGTDEFPAFYSRSSGLRLPHRCDDLRALAKICRTRWGTLAQGGVLVCNPIPAPFEIPAELIVGEVEKSLGEAAAAGVTGKAVTPFLLARIATHTEGNSVRANKALAEHNAHVAGQLAVYLAETSA